MTAPRPGELDPRSRRQRRQAATTARAEARERRWAERRYAVPYDTDGPKATLGLLWGIAALAAATVGPAALATLAGAVAVVAALQAAQAWRPTVAVARPAAAVLAAVPPIGMALGGVRGLGAAVAVAALVAPLVALLAEGGIPARVVRHGEVLVRCALPAALAAGSLGALADVEVGAALTLILLVSAYELGDFIVGTGSTNAVEGPVAGIVSALVVGTVVVVLRPPPFDAAPRAAAFVGLAVVLAPLGQLAASALLPTGAAWAPALRRLDSYLLVAPLWVILL